MGSKQWHNRIESLRITGVDVLTFSPLARSVQLCLSLATLCGLVQAQSQPASRITQPINDRVRITLQGNVHPLAQTRYDQGAVPDSFAADRMFVLLKRSPEREAALEQFLEDAHRPGNPSYHQWLTPKQFGALYGPTDSEIATVSGWLQGQGFSVSRVTEGKTAIEFSGTAGQIRTAFHTEIHTYAADGEQHHANNTDPQIPAALAPVIAGITPLNDFQPRSYLRVGKATYDPETHKFIPDWTFPAGNDALEFAPGDFAMQYDVNPLYAEGITGKGVTIGLIGASNVDPTAVATYRSFFGLPASPLNVVIDGLDPGQNYAAGESYLDVELAGAVAPGATITLYTSAGTSVQNGLYLAAQRAVDDDVAAVLSTSYGACEQELGSSGNQFWAGLWEQAAAQGQTSFVSAGDGGPAGCDDFNNYQPAQYGISMNGFSSTPWNVSVGGTDFYYKSYNGTSAAQQTELGTDWDLTGTLFPTTSLLQPLSEQPWNDPFGLNLANSGVYNANAPDIVAGSGGPSNCASGTDAPDGTYASCAAGYAKPSWQSGMGVPNDGVRDLPDVSLYAAAGENDSFYPFCLGQGFCVVSDGDLTIGIAGGTSASSPSMAGIMALINQKYGPQGQANFTLYPLAAQHPEAFHDVTTGSNVVPCQAGTTNCILSTASDNTKGYYAFGYDATAGYDMASGLGSVDAGLLFQYWNSLTFKPTKTSLALSQTTFTHGAPVKLNVGVTGSGGTPSGSVALVTTATPQSNVGVSAFTLHSGAATATVNSLPGGQYKVSARYGGDNFFGSSTSSPVTVNVAPEASNLSLFGSYYLYANNSTGVLTNGASYPFGTSIVVEAQAVGVNAPAGSNDGIATGTVTFTDVANAGPVSSGPQSMGTASTATWVPTAFSVGSHSLSASYSGDASFNASSSTTPLTFTITKANPYPELSANAPAIAHGQSVTLQLSVGINVGPAPTGTATFYAGNTVLGTATVAQTTLTWPFISSAAILNATDLPVGTDSITAQYSGDTNYEAATSSAVQVVVTNQPLPTLTATANAQSLLPTQDLIVTANVAGLSGQPAPTGSIFFDASGPGSEWTAGCTLVSGSCDFDFSGGTWSPGTVTVTVSYSGDSTYAPSTTVVPVTMLNPFTMKVPTPLSIASPGASTTSNITITPANGFTGPVYLTCTVEYYPPGAQHLPMCSVPASVSVSGTSPVTAAMTISSLAPVSSQNRSRGLRWIAAESGAFVAGFVLLGIPVRRRSRFRIAGLFMAIAMAGLTSCGGGAGGGGGNTVPGTSPGKYIFMVTGSYSQNIGLKQPFFQTQPQVFMVNVNIQ
jgi:subtilase family serine protease